VEEKVKNAWSVPPQSKGLQAIVFLAIDRAGHVEQLRIEKKSGNVLFDESLLRAIKQAAPFPPLPDDYAGRLFERDMVFRPLN
jgi:TonB family protein